jgi:Ulp1 family protease
MMREVGEQLNKNTKKQFQYLNIVKESPKQTYDLDCGVFALFFMECNMHGYTIKQ